MNTTETQKLATFGAKVLAVMTFSKDWNADTNESILQFAVAADLFPNEPQEARELCERFNLNPADHGDSLPTIQFPHTDDKNQHLVSLLNDWHTTRTLQTSQETSTRPLKTS